MAHAVDRRLAYQDDPLVRGSVCGALRLPRIWWRAWPGSSSEALGPGSPGPVSQDVPPTGSSGVDYRRGSGPGQTAGAPRVPATHFEARRAALPGTPRAVRLMPPRPAAWTWWSACCRARFDTARSGWVARAGAMRLTGSRRDLQGDYLPSYATRIESRAYVGLGGALGESVDGRRGRDRAGSGALRRVGVHDKAFPPPADHILRGSRGPGRPGPRLPLARRYRRAVFAVPRTRVPAIRKASLHHGRLGSQRPANHPSAKKRFRARASHSCCPDNSSSGLASRGRRRRPGRPAPRSHSLRRVHAVRRRSAGHSGHSLRDDLLSGRARRISVPPDVRSLSRARGRFHADRRGPGPRGRRRLL